MDDSDKRFLQRLMRRIPTQLLQTTLDKWSRLTAAQRQSMDFTEPKWALTEQLLAICEVRGDSEMFCEPYSDKKYSKTTSLSPQENDLTAKHIAELDMICESSEITSCGHETGVTDPLTLKVWLCVFVFRYDWQPKPGDVVCSPTHRPWR